MSSRFSSLSRGCLVLALAACGIGEEIAPPLVIQLRVVEGDNALNVVGTRATRGITVEVTDETGRPVDAAAVSFQLPADGPSGWFANGGKTEIVTTRSDGRAGVWGMQWNRTPGPFEIRITVSKGRARAGLAVAQTLGVALEGEPRSGGEGTFTASHPSRKKWLIIAAVAGGGVAAGIGLRGSPKSAAAAPTSTPLQIGNPTVLVGHP